MLTGDTIYPIIAIAFYLLLLLRVTSKQIRALIFEWTNAFREWILPGILRFLRSKWFTMPLVVISVPIISFLINRGLHNNVSKAHFSDRNTPPTFSFILKEGEDNTILNDQGYPIISPTYKAKLLKKYLPKLIKAAKKDSCNAVQVVGYETGELWYREFDPDLSLRIVTSISEAFSVDGYDELGPIIAEWVPMVVPMPLMKTGQLYKDSETSGMKIELRLFNYEFDLDSEPLGPSCNYDYELPDNQSLSFYLNNEELCERQIEEYPLPESISKLTFGDSWNGYINVKVCMDANGNVRFAELVQTTQEYVNDLDATETIHAEVAMEAARKLKFSKSYERWQCGEIQFSF